MARLRATWALLAAAAVALAASVRAADPVWLTPGGLPATASTNPATSVVDLRILHVNDMHARVEPTDSSYNPVDPSKYASSYGGLARLAGFVKAARGEAVAAAADILVLHAGDQYTGTAWDTHYTRNGNFSVAEVLNSVGFDAMTIGNHELDFGPANLAGFASTLEAPLLSCNVNASRDANLAGKVKPYTIKTLPVSGKKVAIIGLTTPDTAVISSPGPTVDILTIEASLAGCATAAKAEGAEMIILLSHIGYDKDQIVAATSAFADVDLIIGGHSHTFLYGTPAPGGQPQLPAFPNPSLTGSAREGAGAAGPYPTNVLNGAKTVPVVTALWGGRYVGRLSTTWDLSGSLQSYSGAPVLLGGASSSNPVADDPAVAARVAALGAPLALLGNTVVGVLTTPLVSRGDQESNAGNLACAALRWAADTGLAAAKAVLSANPGLPVVCLENSGGFRTDIPAGNVTLGQVTAVLPFGNSMVLMRIKPATLISTLNNALSGYNSAAGRFCQIGGMRLAFDSRQDQYDRLVDATLDDAGGASLRSYSGDILLLTSSYVARGGDNFTALAAVPVLLDTNVGDAQVVADYITAKSPVAATKDGRIANCATDTSPLASGV
ncbi:multifunctional 2, 3 -cyclic-nucleotide 2 -phosphodiesterase 5 -nucleotidase 3 -nucleotidase [Micractinium conductrix]|uniref:Multifunctional 2, 3 -cyclic-nucleotide 2 -phosphodiesterase 5 -nucleotidase 3 -nucleotidase n=1 Tax=Micractinium conductrix TaxID=554055 RepID=A0A2P6V142_9CHLO|nr:multifunctional 2, 3 -cyclic-nucleotide 2 -phosphodiesterase 5 -nucleotidase 3 -nucleotidase [Micractinium conductrix]|eukprot:PSC67806.1 multifunctional 2, 3 -cyclic-nucleotide 2 -phosphodiesterase 5 -nucleotidase 3 -nucleotidase [Micractinium conductrix]